jgi:hypothetical protein
MEMRGVVLESVSQPESVGRNMCDRSRREWSYKMRSVLEKRFNTYKERKRARERERERERGDRKSETFLAHAKSKCWLSCTTYLVPFHKP